MKMASSTMLGVVLALTMFSTGILADRLTNIYVTNFPLDEQGNLRIGLSEKASQLHNDSVAITVLDWSTRQTIYPHPATSSWQQLDEGVSINRISGPSTFPFVFNPEQTFLNVTDLWFSFALADDSGGWVGYDGYVTFNITLNNRAIYQVTSTIYSGKLNLISVHISEPAACTLIQSNVNTLTLEIIEIFLRGINLHSYQMWMFNVIAFIEYQYLG